MTINLKNFLKDKPKMSKMGEFQQLQEIDGLEISAVSADLYGTGRDDLCLFYFKDGANYGAVYTNNSICSESITWNRSIRKKTIKALLVNTKNANTFTGSQGQEGLESLSKTLAKNLTLKEAQKEDGTTNVVKKNEILFASTGVIGEKFPTQQIKGNIPDSTILHKGCKFSDRCINPSNECKEGNIPMGLIEIKPGHWVDQCCINCD